LRIANYLAIPSLVACVFLLLSFAVLPKEKSHRHYMSVGLLISVVLLEVCLIRIHVMVAWAED
jgi:uncharacterized BrkB/YihY/UPF0761 family membrane protein